MRISVVMFLLLKYVELSGHMCCNAVYPANGRIILTPVDTRSDACSMLKSPGEGYTVVLELFKGATGIGLKGREPW